MDITIEMPIEDWNDLTYIMIEAEAYIHVVGKYGPIPKSGQDKYEKGVKRALEILKNAREV